MVLISLTLSQHEVFTGCRIKTSGGMPKIRLNHANPEKQGNGNNKNSSRKKETSAVGDHTGKHGKNIKTKH